MGWDGLGEASKEDAKRKGGSANCKEKKIVKLCRNPPENLGRYKGGGWGLHDQILWEEGWDAGIVGPSRLHLTNVNYQSSSQPT